MSLLYGTRLLVAGQSPECSDCLLIGLKFFLAYEILTKTTNLRLFKSNERSEYSYIGLADFFLFFFSGKVLKVSNNYRCAFIHIDAFINALRYICTF